MLRQLGKRKICKNFRFAKNRKFNDKTGMTGAKDTWWLRTIEQVGMELCVNMGINDFNAYNQQLKTSVELNDFKAAYKKIVDKIMETYKGHSDNFTLFVFTLLPSVWGDSKWCKGDGLTGIDEAQYQKNLEQFNQVIRDIASETEGVEVVDLFRSLNFTRETIKPYTADSLHPNAKGMRLISNCFIRALYNKFVGK